jgi:hypothetical protein
MKTGPKFLPRMGRGTMRSMVEGHPRITRGRVLPKVPLHHPAGGHPPPLGEEA